MMQTDSTTTRAPAVYRHTSQWTHATHVTAELPAEGETYTHWWVTFRGVAVRPPDARGQAWRDHPPTPCYADDDVYVARIPYVTGGTRVFSDVVWEALWGGFLAPVPAAWHQRAGDGPTAVHISLSAPLPACADVDDPSLLHHWTHGSGDPRRAWLWDAPTTGDDNSTPPAGAPAAAPALWCDGLAEEEIRTLRDELKAELARRGNGSQGTPVAAWMGELTSAELSDMYADLKNEIVKRGLKGNDKEPGI